MLHDGSFSIQSLLILKSVTQHNADIIKEEVSQEPAKQDVSVSNTETEGEQSSDQGQKAE